MSVLRMNIMDKAFLLVRMKNRPLAETGDLVSSTIFIKNSETGLWPLKKGKVKRRSQNAHDHWEQLVAVNFWQLPSLSTVGKWIFTPAASS